MLSCLVDPIATMITEVIWKNTVVRMWHQLKFVFCYKSFMDDMETADHDLENKKELVEKSAKEASNNLREISGETNEWLGDVSKAQKEVRSLLRTREEDEERMSSCSGYILNPIVRHQLGWEAAKKKGTIDELLEKKPNTNEISFAPSPSGIVNEAAAAAAAAQQQIEGVCRSSGWGESFEQIMRALNDQRHGVVGLYGMGGVGKSTMIEEVRLQVIAQRAFDKVIKVEVKAKPEIKRIQEEIASKLGLKLENESLATRAERLCERLLMTDRKEKEEDEKNDMEKKKKTKILIILDDLVKKLDLEEVGIPVSNDKVQIKLLLTSRYQNLLSDQMGVRKPIFLNILDKKDALKMFKFYVGDGDKGVEPGKVSAVVEKCSGLPIVIKVTAIALKDRDQGEWEQILERLDTNDVVDKLKVSYDYLPSKESKDLFLLCGTIRGPLIQVSDLLKYTYGLGLYEGKDHISTLSTAATELKKLLSGLEAASMLLKVDDNRYVKIHDWMRDLAVKIVETDRLEWVHFTLRDDSYKLPRKFEATKVELLMSYCEGSSLQVPDSFFKDMKKLYVLEFTNLCGALSLPSPLDQLGDDLGTLCLHNCSLSDISMIGGAKRLQILSFRGSNICKLPVQLGELTSIKMLDLSDCKELKYIEPGVLVRLTKLEELNMENSFEDWDETEGGESPRNARLTELRNMSRLSNVRIHIPRSSMLPIDGQMFSSRLTMYKISLDSKGIIDGAADRHESRVLSLYFWKSADILRLGWVQDTLQRAEFLYLRGNLGSMHESINDLCFNGFECLKHLKIVNFRAIKYIVSSSCGNSMKNLESLSLGLLNNLEKLCDGLPEDEEPFSKLKTVEVSSCRELTHLFNFSSPKGFSSQLEEITVKKCRQMQSIFVDENDKSDAVITLLKLQKLELESLPNFSSFCVPQGRPHQSMTILITPKKVALPHLESLRISGINKVEYIWHPEEPLADDSLGKIRFLTVESCNKLLHVINSRVLMTLQQNLETLTVSKCELISQVFDVEEDVIISGAGCTDHLLLFSRLKQLQLSSMDRLKAIYNHYNNPIRSVTIFPNIESLNVSNCPELGYVLSSSLPPKFEGFQHLKDIIIAHCGVMEAVVQLMSDTHDHQVKSYVVRYSSLKVVAIEGCPKLKTFCRRYNYASEQVSVVPHFFSQRDFFPCVETIKLDHLGKFEEIWHHEVVAAVQESFCKVKIVEVVSCPKLLSVFPSRLIKSLEKELERIDVRECESMKSIIVNKKAREPRRENQEPAAQKEHDHQYETTHDQQAIMTTTINLPLLSRLVFENLPNLHTFYSSSDPNSCGFNFPSLERLRIQNCPGVKRLFLQPHAAGMERAAGDDLDKLAGALFGYSHKVKIPRMDSLNLWRFENLNEIWKRQEYYDESGCSAATLRLHFLTLASCPSSWRTANNLRRQDYLASPPLSLRVVTKLTVSSFHKLGYIFTPVGAKSLEHLTSLYIYKCDNIMEIVANDDNNEKLQGGGDVCEINFNNLTELMLSDLPRLQSFSSSASENNFVLNFPALGDLWITNCPKMRIFSNGVVRTPKLHELCWNMRELEVPIELYEGELNTTIQQLNSGTWPGHGYYD